ncbi:MAG: hypothetical protein G01um101470_864 [Parcubacteria group bacterium Gr01-1014_70]|nr:MAG: hypothetical protein G01um101470_864 [Parcubacteria group bacterium Gr01-1014_70]
MIQNQKTSIKPVLRVFWQHARRYKLAVFIVVFFHAGVHIVETIVPLYYRRAHSGNNCAALLQTVF